MNKRNLILILYLFLSIEAAFSMIPLTEGFDAAPHGWQVLRDGTFNGDGTFTMNEDDYIYRNIQGGSFQMVVDFNDIDMGSPTDGNSNRFYYRLNHSGDNVEGLDVFFHKSETALKFAVDEVLASTSTRAYTEDLASLTSCTLKVVWDEGTGEYTVSAGFNGGAIVQKVIISGYAAPSVNRTEYFYGTYKTLEAGKPAIEFDRYQMSTGPTIAGQIDSMDDIAAEGWYTNTLGASISQDNITYTEGTGSLKIDAGTGNIDVFDVISADMSPADQQYLMFQMYGDGSGNQVTMFLYDGENELARCLFNITWTGWRPYVLQLDEIGKDASITFDYDNITRIRYLIVDGGGGRGDVNLDDLRLSREPMWDRELSYCEGSGTTNKDIWRYTSETATGASRSYDTADKTEGMSSLSMTFPGPTTYQQVYIQLRQYYEGAASVKPRDVTDYEYIEFDLYGDGSDGLFQLRFTGTGTTYLKNFTISHTGWKSYKFPLSEFTGSGTSPDWSLIDTIRMYNPGGAAMNLKIDNIRMTNNTPPLVPPYQIDSMDDIAATGWYANTGTISQDTVDFIEGTGSLQSDAGTEPGDAMRIYDANLLPINENYLQFQVNGDGSGNRVHLFLYDKDGDLARCLFDVTWTGWRPYVLQIEEIGADSNSLFDYDSINNIRYLIQDEGSGRGDINIDDIRLETAPTADREVSYCEGSGATDADVWRSTMLAYSGATASYDTTEKTEGSSSVSMQFGTTAYQQVALWLKQYYESAAQLATMDFTDYEYISFDLYEDGSGNRLEFRFMNGGAIYYTRLHMNETGWKTYTIPRSSFQSTAGADWTQIDTVRFYNPDGTAMNIRIDNLRMTNTFATVCGEQSVMNADKATITVDGDSSDWTGLDSDVLEFDLALVPNQPNGNLKVQYQLAWDDDYLYVLVEELPGDGVATEAPGLDWMDDGAGGDVQYDSLSLYCDFDNGGGPSDGATGIDMLMCLGLTSAADANDLMMAWTNGDWGPHKPDAVANGKYASKLGGATLGNRLLEAKVKWSDLDSHLETERQPDGGLLSAIQPGFIFGCDPRLNDLEETGNKTAEESAAWLNGTLWANQPTGTDVSSIDVRLICSPGDLDGDCDADMEDFAVFGSQWQETGCCDLNDYCLSADIDRDQSVGINDLADFAKAWLD